MDVGASLVAAKAFGYVESTFSMVKAKFRDSVRSRSDVGMVNEALCKFLCHNLRCVIMAQCELGIEAEFWKDDDKDAEEEAEATPEIIRFPDVA